jgi:hypothetical protein
MARDGALAGANLGKVIARLRIDGRDDALDDAGVVEEVLAESFPWAVGQWIVLVFLKDFR